ACMDPFLAALSAAAFTLCGDAPRINCVVDGDTFWIAGEKVRLADINAPETHQAGCAAERELGVRATRRLIALLNAGPFTLEIEGRGTDRYGRALRVARRGGSSIGQQLVREGLAEPWRGRRSDWCILLARD
ncbi:MAG TPA: thermonuclease family protein, partial [Novosphingobium sp.]|nr:thermonuclease family protein [Novosphingobium sp.]